ncbi:MAG TPA: type II toxin-antitoxin system Phd/YefM family antitoxin [Anaerolineae bacterium]|nr:type II toxin-antitoxin system Phd/YefM family antitoxin [Anaerolineae bacterium]
MGRVVSATEARIRFGELMRQAVENHETIVVERGGKSHVVVMSVEEYERLLKQQQQGDWNELVQGVRAKIRSELGDRTLPRPEEILDQVREGRDGQLLRMR